MHIDRSNYEIWCIEWLDGRLTGSQAGMLRAFLDQNPDLREEFEEMSAALPGYPLIPYPGSERLMKTPGEMSTEQFELLCAAYLENDLDRAGKEELEEMVSSDPERRRIFGQMQKTKIVPQRIIYKRKKSLLKLSAAGRAWRLSVTALGAAAAIILLMIALTGIFNRQNILKDPAPEQAVAEQKKEVRENKAAVASLIETEKPVVSNNISSVYVKAKVPGKIIPQKPGNTGPVTASADIATTRPGMSVEKVAFNPAVGLAAVSVPDSLIAVSREIPTQAISMQSEEDEGFMTRVIKDKILREKPAGEKRRNGYEIAEAGVEGLNKLLGWNMALNTSTDETGQTKSVSFRSRLLKIQAPVKKNADRP